LRRPFIIPLFFLVLPACLPSAGAQDIQTVELNGISLAYRVLGEGEPLVLLHGFTQTGSSAWDPVIDDLSPHFNLIIPDLRGHGDSTNPSGVFTHAQSALDIFGLLDHLQIEDFKAMGISSGGMTLLHMATTQPERLSAMVLIGASSRFPETARDIMRRNHPDSLPQSRLEASGRIHGRGIEQARELWGQFNAMADSYRDMNFTPPLLSTISARTLIIHGDRDPFFPVAIPVEEYQAIPEAYLWIVPNGGHVPLMNSAQDRSYLIKQVLAFLGGGS